jgi:hypothetical protein
MAEHLRRCNMTKKPTVPPGGKVPDSGIYQDGSGKRATMVKGEPAPPTSKAGQTWKQVIDTNKEKK